MHYVLLNRRASVFLVVRDGALILDVSEQIHAKGAEYTQIMCICTRQIGIVVRVYSWCAILAGIVRAHTHTSTSKSVLVPCCQNINYRAKQRQYLANCFANILDIRELCYWFHITSRLLFISSLLSLVNFTLSFFFLLSLICKHWK